MEQQLTNEEIVKVFSTYWGTPTNWVPTNSVDCARGENQRINQYFFGEMSTFNIVRSKLLLKPLSSITDEHIKILLSLMSNDEEEISYAISDKNWKYTKEQTIKALSELDYKVAENEIPIIKFHFVFQQLILLGYAVPLFFGINHWANSKTAIELGIAIDKK